MTINSSEIVVVPRRFFGIRVLLIEPDESSLAQHAYMLSQNSYRVTSTTKLSTGLSMIHDGQLYDCVLVDVDIHETDMVDFIHQVLKRQPELSIIMMVSDGIHMMRFVTEALKNEAILCLVKPCDLNDICNIWNHVYRKRIASEKHDSKGKLPQTNIIRRIDPMVKSFATLNRELRTNNNISQEYDAMINPGYLNFGNDVGTGTTRNIYKGKQPIDNVQRLEDVTYQKKRKNNKPRINWTEALHNKFLEALNKLGKQNAYPSEILKHMNVPGLTRNQVASHLQKLQRGEKVIKKPRLIHMVQRGDNLLAKSDTSKRSGQLILSDNHRSIIQSSSLEGPLGKINSIGMSCMNINNIKTQMQESTLLVSTPHPTPNIMSNVGVDQVTDHRFGDTFRFHMGETSMSYPVFRLVKNSDSGCSQGNEVQMTGYGYKNATSEDYSHHSSKESVAQSGVGATFSPYNNLGVVGANNLSNNFDNRNSWGASGSGVSDEAREPFIFYNCNSIGASGQDHTLFGIDNPNSRGASGSGVNYGGRTPFGLDNGNSKDTSSTGVSKYLPPFDFDNGNSKDDSGSGFNKVLRPLCFDHYNSPNASGSSFISEPLAQFDCFGIPIDS